MPFTFSDNI